MVRRGCETEAAPASEIPKKKSKMVTPENALNSSFVIDQPLPSGVVMTDVCQKEWRIGKPIGCGSFGQIYLASDNVNCEVTSESARYVLKVEPHSNGPLFVEMHCLIRTARQDMIKQWQKEKNLKSLGMPIFIASGSHILADNRYRFLVLPRYQMDLHKLSRNANYGRINPRNVLVLAAQILDVLEYLHAKGYTHSDIKSSNLMVGFDPNTLKDLPLKQFKLSSSVNIDQSVSTSSSYQQKGSSFCPLKRTQNRCTTMSSYYEDEDFNVNGYLSDATTIVSGEVCENKNSRSLRNKKVATFKRSNRIKAFNLRKHNPSINYRGEDENSSVCSDSSYEEDVNPTSKDSDEGFHDGTRSKRSSESNNDDSKIDLKECIFSQSPGQVYLLDFGLASKFVHSNGTHKELSYDQRRAHDGTLEYSSRDSHMGAHSRRSDLETLGFNLLDWLTGALPWKNPEIMDDPELVYAVKKKYMEEPKRFLETCFKTMAYPTFIEKYIEYVNQLKFAQKPDYSYCKNLFIEEFISLKFGTEKDMVLNFECETEEFPQKKKNYSKKVLFKKTQKEFVRRNVLIKPSGRENLIFSSWENGLKMDLLKECLNLSNDGYRKPCASRNFYVSDSVLISKLRLSLLPNLETPSKKFSPKNLRSKNIISKKKKGAKNKRSSIGKFGNFLGSGKQYTWAEILAGNPEDIIRKVDKEKSSNDSWVDTKNPRSRKISNASDVSLSNDVNASPNLLRKDFLTNRNPTYAMRMVVEQYRRKISGKPPLQSDFNESANLGSNHCPYTYGMLMVMQNKNKNLKLKHQTTRQKQALPVVKNVKTIKNDIVKSSKLIKNGNPKRSVKKTNVQVSPTLQHSKKDVCIDSNSNSTEQKAIGKNGQKNAGKPAPQSNNKLENLDSNKKGQKSNKTTKKSPCAIKNIKKSAKSEIQANSGNNSCSYNVPVLQQINKNSEKKTKNVSKTTRAVVEEVHKKTGRRGMKEKGEANLKPSKKSTVEASNQLHSCQKEKHGYITRSCTKMETEK